MTLYPCGYAVTPFMCFSTFIGFKNDKQIYYKLYMPSEVYIKVGTQICRYALTITEKIFTLWIRGYVVTEYPRIHLSLGASLKWQGIL